MPASLDLQRLVHMSHELLFMAWHGVQPKRLGMLALDLLLARESAARLVRGAPDPAAEDRGRRALAFISRLEEQVLRLYATHALGPQGVLSQATGYGGRRR
ncbi:MAG: hypothetical protein ACE5I4_07810 [Thermoplasmata archaeon]